MVQALQPTILLKSYTDYYAKISEIELLFVFKILVYHRPDEVVEAVIPFRFAVSSQGSMRIGLLAQLCLKPSAVVIEQGELFVGGSSVGFERREQCSSAPSCFAKMLQMCEFCALRRCSFVVTRIGNDKRLGGTCICDYTVCVTQVFGSPIYGRCLGSW